MSGPTKPLRLLFIACAGVGTLYAAAHWGPGPNPAQVELADVVSPAARAAARSAALAPAAAASVRPSASDREFSLSTSERSRSIPSSKGELFASLSWLPPPPPPPAPPPPAPASKPVAPVTPPLPFTFVGMLERGAAMPEAFLAKGDALLVVSVGDMLDNNTYRVDTLNANEVVMTYLPMNTKQTLNVSGGTK